MTIHGFCIGTDFAVTEQTESSIRFTLRSNEKTLSMYPFHFTFHVCYTLRGNQIRKTCLVENRDSREMYFGIGGHPGFNVPLNGEGSFEDWELDFAEPCQPVRVDMDPANYRLAGTESPYPLKNGRTIPLTHALFDLDGRTAFITHGHLFNLDNLPPHKPGDLLIHGHTHVLTVQEKDGMTYINPGSAALPKEDHPKSYMIYENGVFTIKTLTGDVILTHTL